MDILVNRVSYLITDHCSLLASTSTEPMLAQILSFSAQLFFAWRCFVLMDRNYFILFGLLAGKDRGADLHITSELMCNVLAMLCSLSLSIYATYLYSIMPFNFAIVSSSRGLHGSNGLTYPTCRSSDSVRARLQSQSTPNRSFFSDTRDGS